MKINLGCGRDYLEGYVNCEINKRYKADLYFDMESDKWPFKDSSVKVVKAYHIFEHLSTGYLHAWKEMYRVCKHNALIELAFPHHWHDNYFSDPTHKTPVTIDGIRLFDKENNQEHIDKGYSISTLGLDLDIDFRIKDTFCNINPMLKDTEFDKIKDRIMELTIHNVNIIEEVFVKLCVNKVKTKG